MNKIYSGIGSRSTPADVQWIMSGIAKTLAFADWTLRSGGAMGADLSFELGCEEANGKSEIYLPWARFGMSRSELIGVCPKALEIAASIHPAWDKCNDQAKRLHARNAYQILGKDLNTPTDFVLCWTENGEKVGGTRTAIVLAERHNIPVYNMGDPNFDMKGFKEKYEIF